jgi:hypothetical protein
VYDLSYYCSPEYAFRDVAVDVTVDVREEPRRRRRCSEVHPTWMRCPYGATRDPEVAAARAATNPDPTKYAGPFVQVCRAAGAATNCPGGAPGERYYCIVAFWDNLNQVRRQTWSVNCCRCCWPGIDTEGTSCLALHLAAGGGGSDLLP